MNDKSIQVLEQYDLQIIKTWRGRGALLAETEDGCYRLCEYRGSEARLAYQEELLNYLSAASSVPVNELIRTAEGNLYATDRSGEKYILNRHYCGNECEVKNKNDVLIAVRTLAFLHKKLEHVVFSETEYIPVLDSCREEICRHNKELKRIRKYLIKKTVKSEFEYAVLSHFGEYFEIAAEAERRFALSGYDEAQRQAVEQGMICHGNYHYHNIVRMGSKTAVINFEHSGRGLLIRDLCLFLRKVMEKHDWNERLGIELVEEYDKIRTIPEAERETMEILLTYPEKFWKVLNHYYNSNKAYLPDLLRSKLAKVCAQQSKKALFVTELSGR